MQVSVRVRDYSQEDLRLWIAIAADIGMPIAEIKSSPMGLFMPVDLAVKAGVIESVPCIEAPKPKRGGRRPAAKVEETASWDS